MSTDPEQYVAECKIINDTIDRHAKEALRLLGPQHRALETYGHPDWAKANWHGMVAQHLRNLSHGAAIAHIREHALTALANGKEPDHG